MSKPLVTILGKAVKKAASLRGGGSALPGLVVEHIDPNFVKRTLSQLPRGVVIISGTNGKTTTTKMAVELLESQGLRVFTNRTGSNFSRGVAAALLAEVNIRGKLNADIAVLELDEAHAVLFAKRIPPRVSLLLNVARDQLDRFGEIDKTANLLRRVANNTLDTVVLNREDPRISPIANTIGNQKARFFGLDEDLLKLFPNDDDLRRNSRSRNPVSEIVADVVLSKLSKDYATFFIDKKPVNVKLQLSGLYNVFNAAAAIALVRAILGEAIDQPKLIEALSKVTPAFGRGEVLRVNNQPLELVLVKNPSGFRLGLESFDPKNFSTMIAINDNYADGRDMSWLWDVDFSSLKESGVSTVSGIRAYDMALRLKYDEISVKHTEANIKKALNQFIEGSKDKPKRIYCTYTAMLNIRRLLSKITKVETVE